MERILVVAAFTSAQMFSVVSRLISLYKILGDVKLINTHPGLILAVTAGVALRYLGELYYFPEFFVKNRKVLVLPITRKSYTTEDSVIMTRSSTSMVYLAVAMAMYVGGKKEDAAAMADYCLDLPYGYNDMQNAALIGFIGQFLSYKARAACR